VYIIFRLVFQLKPASHTLSAANRALPFLNCSEHDPEEHDPETWKPAFGKDHAQRKATGLIQHG
jgi:hypothetical protein